MSVGPFLAGPPATLKQIHQEIEEWIQSPSSRDGLEMRIEGLLGSIRESAAVLNQDLERGRPAPDFQKLLVETVEVYQDLETCLEEIQSGVASSRTELVAEELAYLKAATSCLRQHTEDIEAWLQAPYLRCPKCGFGTESSDVLCPECNLELLYPDLEPDYQAARQFLHLGPGYAAVYKVYLKVLAGEATLAELQQPLAELKTIVKSYPRLSGAGADATLRATLLQLSELCREVCEGMDQMERAFSSRESSDLNQGWLRIFTAAGQLQAILQPLLAEQGMGSALASSPGADSVQFSE